jgi:hypothetical protein
MQPYLVSQVVLIISKSQYTILLFRALNNKLGNEFLYRPLCLRALDPPRIMEHGAPGGPTYPPPRITKFT